MDNDMYGNPLDYNYEENILKNVNKNLNGRKRKRNNSNSNYENVKNTELAENIVPQDKNLNLNFDLDDNNIEWVRNIAQQNVNQEFDEIVINDNNIYNQTYNDNNNHFINQCLQDKYYFKHPRNEYKLEMTGAQIVKTLGSGSYGVVHQMCLNNTDCKYAVKIISPIIKLSPDGYVYNDYLENGKYEAAITEMMYNQLGLGPKFYGAWHCNGKIWIVQELMAGHLRSEDMKNPDIIRQIKQQLDILHENGWVHRDIKPSNILYKIDIKTGTKLVYIADFGLARPISNNTKIPQATFDNDTVYVRQMTNDDIRETLNTYLRYSKDDHLVSHVRFKELDNWILDPELLNHNDVFNKFDN